jgi:hypothetical protein
LELGKGKIQNQKQKWIIENKTFSENWQLAIIACTFFMLEQFLSPLETIELS